MMRHAFAIFTLTAIGLLGLCCFCQTSPDGLGGMVGQSHSDGGQSGHVAEADLYVKPQPHPLRKDYPELFQSEAVVLCFGSDWCGPCKRQAAALAGPAQRYHILKVRIEEERWRTLWEKLELGGGVPVTVVMERGEVVKTFKGFTPWREIMPHADKAAKPEKERDLRIRVGLVHIDLTDGVDVSIYRRGQERDLRAWLILVRDWLVENWDVVVKLALSLLLLL